MIDEPQGPTIVARKGWVVYCSLNSRAILEVLHIGGFPGDPSQPTHSRPKLSISPPNSNYLGNQHRTFTQTRPCSPPHLLHFPSESFSTPAIRFKARLPQAARLLPRPLTWIGLLLPPFLREQKRMASSNRDGICFAGWKSS